MDMKRVFLNGNIYEDVYMTQLEGFIFGNSSKVCKLKRSIYGLKQTIRSWDIRFDEIIKEFGFSEDLDEPCVYKKVSGSAIVFLVLYVDDIYLSGTKSQCYNMSIYWLSRNILHERP